MPIPPRARAALLIHYCEALVPSPPLLSALAHKNQLTAVGRDWSPQGSRAGTKGTRRYVDLYLSNREKDNYNLEMIAQRRTMIIGKMPLGAGLFLLNYFVKEYYFMQDVISG